MWWYLHRLLQIKIFFVCITDIKNVPPQYNKNMPIGLRAGNESIGAVPDDKDLPSFRDGRDGGEVPFIFIGTEGSGGEGESLPSRLLLHNISGFDISGRHGDGERKGKGRESIVGDNGGSDSRNSSPPRPPIPHPPSPPPVVPEKRGGQGVGDKIQERLEYSKGLQDLKGPPDADRKSFYYKPLSKENRRKVSRYGDDIGSQPNKQKQNHRNRSKSRKYRPIVYRYKPQRKRYPSDGKRKLGEKEDQSPTYELRSRVSKMTVI